MDVRMQLWLQLRQGAAVEVRTNMVGAALTPTTFSRIKTVFKKWSELPLGKSMVCQSPRVMRGLE